MSDNDNAIIPLDNDSSEAPTTAPTEVEEFTPEAREAMKQDIINNMQGIQQLIHQYQKQTEELQEDVAGFVLRDVEEQNSVHAIAASVQADQQEALRNPHYLRWAAASGKGEFAPTTDGVQEDVAADDDWVWFDDLPCDLQPAAVLSLEAFPGVKPFLAGWRRKNAAISQQLHNLSEALLQSAVEGSTEESCGSFVLCLNGHPLYDLCLYQDETVSHALQEARQEWGSVEGAAAWYQSRILRSSSVASASSIHDLLCTSPCTSSALLDGTSDYIALIPMNLAAQGVICRMVAIDGTVRAVEVCDSHANIFASYIGKPAEVVDEVILRVATTMAQRIAGCNGASTQQLITGFVSVSEDGAASWVITDARQLSPSCPYRWYLSWPEICGLGRASIHAASATVRRTRSRLASLDPTDDLSRRWFDAMNKAMHAPSRPEGQTVTPATPVTPPPSLEESPTSTKVPTTSPHSNFQLALVAVGAAAIGIAATLVATKRGR